MQRHTELLLLEEGNCWRSLYLRLLFWLIQHFPFLSTMFVLIISSVKKSTLEVQWHRIGFTFLFCRIADLDTICWHQGKIMQKYSIWVSKARCSRDRQIYAFWVAAHQDRSQQWFQGRRIWNIINNKHWPKLKKRVDSFPTRFGATFSSSGLRAFAKKLQQKLYPTSHLHPHISQLCHLLESQRPFNLLLNVGEGSTLFLSFSS